ncbi:asparaginase [Atopobium fossor]|uniref:asparaginase n=1 Tax=Atopobium fossor TaxID=39487 RepID=UPI0004080CED|nr:asparaginase [Atopobium fossor]
MSDAAMPNLKTILMIATGGTIASTGQVGQLTPTLSGRELVQEVPLLEGLCNLDYVQPMNIDSTNMRPRNWLEIAALIEKNYDSYDGFVILHGTDTMAYTAAALSYLIQGSPKPIVLTGSQQPMGNPFTDAKLNMYQSLLYACDDASRDVSIVFSGQVICGTRAHKQRTMSFNAFTSMNFPAIAVIRNNKIIRTSTHTAVEKPCKLTAAPRFYHQLDEKAIVLKLTPELNPSIFELLKRDYNAIILETFGIGGIPEHADASYKKAIFDWVDSGRTLVITTQVDEEGLDLGVYEVSHAYANHPGILRDADMSTEALVAKTMWVLGQTHDPQERAELFYAPINHDRMDL